MLAQRGTHVALAVAVAAVTLYAGHALSAWLYLPGAIILALLVAGATDLFETLAIRRALRSVQSDERFAQLSEDADRLLAQGLPEAAEIAYLRASEHRDDRAEVIVRYMQLATRSRGAGDYKGAKRWLERAKRMTTQ